MKGLHFFWSCCCLFMQHKSQLLRWNTFGNTGLEQQAGVLSSPNISSSNMTMGAGITPANTNRFGGSNWLMQAIRTPVHWQKQLQETITLSLLFRQTRGNIYCQLTKFLVGFFFLQAGFTGITVFHWRVLHQYRCGDRIASGTFTYFMTISLV